MCSPIAIAAVGLGLQAVGAVSSYTSQKSQVEEQKKQDAAYTLANTEAAITSADVNMADISLRQSQELLATGTQKYDAGQETIAAISSTKAAAADANVSGHSVDAILTNIAGVGNTNQTRISANSDMTQLQLQRQKDAEIVQARNNINTVRPTNLRTPSLITPLISIGTASLGAYDYYKSKQPK